jgi:cell division septum initiation protein DivIVA
MSYKLAKNLQLPDTAVTMKIAIVGRTGSGKTNTAVVLAEQMIDNGVPIVILDPQGDWWGLRSKYRIAILGGEHGDVPLEPTGGTIAADFVVNERVPVLLDLFRMGEAEMVRFATDFAKRLWQTNRDAVHLFLDEADLFAPQSGMTGPKAQSLGAFQNVCRRGRSRGIGLTMITQRPAVLNKDLLSQADPFIVHRLTAPQDLSAVDAYFEYHGMAKPDRRGLTERISKFQPGTAIVLSPGELQIEPTAIDVPLRKSHNSSATPQAGKKTTEPRSVADVDLTALQKLMADTIERHKRQDPKELQKRIAELEKQLKSQPVRYDEKAISAAVAEVGREWRQKMSELEASIKTLQKRHATAYSITQRLAELFDTSNVTLPADVVEVPRPNGRTPAPVAKSVARSAPPADSSGLSKAERLILRAMFWLNGEEANPAKVSFYSGYSATSSGFSNALGRLRSLGLVEGWRITDAGIAAVPDDVEDKPRGAELREWLRPRLSKAENSILDVLMDAGGDRLANSEIAERSGYSLTSSGFSNALGKLRTILAAEGYEKDGGTKAHDVFFQ